MANGRELLTGLGTSLLAAGGPQGQAAATSLLNKRATLEAEQQAAQDERKLAAAQANFEIWKTALENPDITDPTEREVIKNQAMAAAEAVGLDPSVVDTFTPQKIKPQLITTVDEKGNKVQKFVTPEEGAAFAVPEAETGQIVKAVDFNPSAPKDLFLIQNPNGNLTAIRRRADGSIGDKVTFKTQEMEDGTIGVIAQRQGERPVFAGPLTTEEGGLAPRTGVAGRAESREGRLTEQQRLNVEKDNLNNLQEDSKNIRVMETALNQLDAILATPADQMSGLDAKALQNTLSNLLNTSVRAQAELESFKNFGDLGQRINQTFTRFLAGRPTVATVEQAKDLVRKFRDDIVDPGKNEIETFYKARTQRQGGDPRNVIRGETGRTISEMTTEELQEERRRLLSGGAR